MAENLSVQPQITTKKDNLTRNTLIATGLGAIGGGAAGYITKNPMHNGEMTDEFVNAIRDVSLKEAGKDNKYSYKALKDLLKMEDNPSVETIKNFITKHAKFFNLDKESLKKVLAKFDETASEEWGKRLTIIKNTCIAGADKIVESVKNGYDKENKKFMYTEEQGMGIINKAIRSVKYKSGLIWGGAGAVVLGFGTWVLSKISGNKEV